MEEGGRLCGGAVFRVQTSSRRCYSEPLHTLQVNLPSEEGFAIPLSLPHPRKAPAPCEAEAHGFFTRLCPYHLQNFHDFIHSLYHGEMTNTVKAGKQWGRFWVSSRLISLNPEDKVCVVFSESGTYYLVRVKSESMAIAAVALGTSVVSQANNF